mgnify:FL=1
MKYRLEFNPSEVSYKSQFFTDAIRTIVLVNVAVYILQSLSGKEDVFFRLFGLVPSSFLSELMIWQPFTYMFFHAPFYSSVGISHILLNMIGLWVFGRELEQAWGKNNFLKYYFVTGIGSGLVTFLFQINSDSPVIGASGAVYGVLLAYGLSYPNRMLYIWGIIPVKSLWLVIIMGTIAFFGLLGNADGISHVTHISGMVIGYFMLNKKWRWRELLFKIRKKTIEFQVQRHEEKVAKKIMLKKDIDLILDKIQKEGFSSLTSREKNKLYESSKNMSKQKEMD